MNYWNVSQKKKEVVGHAALSPTFYRLVPARRLGDEQGEGFGYKFFGVVVLWFGVKTGAWLKAVRFLFTAIRKKPA